MFAHRSDGWHATAAAVGQGPSAALPYSADGLPRPIRFGKSNSDLLELALDTGTAVVSAPGLTVNGAPAVSDTTLTYASVAVDTDLRYTVSPAGLKEELVLKSASAPTRFSFHIADPNHALGSLTTLSDGRVRFTNSIDGGVSIDLLPPTAFAQSQTTSGPAPPTPVSASMSASANPNGGFDIAVAVNSTWLAGQQFPVVLDPTVSFDASNGMLLGWTYNNPSGCGGCQTLMTGGDFETGTYSPYHYQPARTFMRFDLSPIPATSAIRSATLHTFTSGCMGGVYPCNLANLPMELRQLDGTWGSTSTYSQLLTLTHTSAFSTMTSTWVINSFGNGTDETADLTSEVGSWVSGSTANNGFVLKLQNEATYDYGPYWCGHYYQPYCLQSQIPFFPYLQVSYLAAPTGVTASATGSQATVSWQIPSPTDTSIASYTATAFDSSNAVVATQTVCGTCGSATFSGLSLAPATYRFSVHATDPVGNGPESTSVTVSMPLPVTVSVTPSQATYTRGQAVKFTATVTNPTSSAVAVTNLGDNLNALGTPAGTQFTQAGGSCPSCASGSTSVTLTNGTGVSVAAGQSVVFTYYAVLTGSERGCASSADSITGSTLGSTSSGNVSLLVCDNGLGSQRWWSFATQPTGPAASLAVNAANGNGVYSEQDGTGVPGHSGIVYSLQRTYNSEDTGLLRGLPDASGTVNQYGPAGSPWPGWTFSVGGLGDPSSPSLAPAGLYIPAEATVSQPLGPTLIDATGTRQVFTHDAALATAIQVTGVSSGASALLGVLVPKVVAPETGYAAICADSAYSPPAGVHISLWRYVEVNASGSCSNIAAGSPKIAGYGAETTDRTRYEFAWDGRLLDMAEGAGNELRYAYEQAPTPLVELGRLKTVWEPLACDPTLASTCRALRFTYPSGSEIDVTDPAGRLTRYTSIASGGEVGQLQVKIEQDGTSVTFGYQAGQCGGAANQLCSVTDHKSQTSRLTYTAATSGPARAASLTDRRGSPLTFNYVAGTPDYMYTQRAGSSATERVYYYYPDSHGRVYQIQETDSSNVLRQATFYWDTGSAPSNCRQPDGVIDNNLCRVVRAALNNGATPDEDTQFTYNPEGQTLVVRQAVDSSHVVYQTFGFSTLYAQGDGSLITAAQSPAGGGSISYSASSPTYPTASTLYALSDPASALTARGNAPGASIASFTTTYHVDNSSAQAPDQPLSGPSAGFCGTTAYNSGRVCEVDSPWTDATHLAVTKYTYDGFGQRSTMVPANVASASPPGCPGGGVLPAYQYQYIYYNDANLDLGGNTDAGGWLKGIVDPCGQFEAYAYDAGGDLTRSWDRNATAASGGSLSSFTGRAADSTLGSNYAETDYGTGSSAAYDRPGRYLTSVADPLRETTVYTRDGNGNATAVQPPRGSAAGNWTFNITQTFDADDNLLTLQMPEEAASGAKTTYGYDVFNNPVSATDPLGKVVSHSYDGVNRLVQTTFTRGPWPADTSTVPTACSQNASAQISCSTLVAYDGVDNVTSSEDANHQPTSHTYDGIHRDISTLTPRWENGVTTVRTDHIYDPDGNVTDVCPPNQFANGGSCGSPGAFSEHYAYDAAGNRTAVTTYRDAGTANTTALAYDAERHLTSSTDPGASVATTDTYDRLGRLTAVAVPRTGSTTYTTTYSYDPSGHRTQVALPPDPNTSPSGTSVTSYSYDAAGREVAATQGSSSDNAGFPRAGVGGSNLRWQTDYDADGHVISRWSPDAFLTTTPDTDFKVAYDYDRDGRMVAMYQPRYDSAASDHSDIGTLGSSTQTTQCPAYGVGDGRFKSTTGVCKTTAAYDAAGHLTKVVLPTSNGTDGRFDLYKYTDDGLVFEMDAPNPTGQAGSVASTYLFDAVGRVVKVTDPLGHQQLNQWSSDGLKVTDQRQANLSQSPGTSILHTWTYLYDLNGNRTSQTDGYGNVTNWTYTTDNLLLTATDGANDANVSNQTKYGYDPTGHVTQVWSPSAMAGDANNTSRTPTVMTYTLDHLLASTVAPVSPDGTLKREVDYSYDPAGWKTAATTQLDQAGGPTGATTQTFDYFDSGRLHDERGRDGTTIRTYVYDGAGQTLGVSGSGGLGAVTATYYLDGLSRCVTNPNSLTQYTYDGGGAMAARGDSLAPATCTGSPLVPTAYTYNDAGLPASETSGVTASGSRATSWTYDADGCPTSEAIANGMTKYWGYYEDNFVSYQQVKDAGGNAVAQWNYNDDSDYRIVDQTYNGPSAGSGNPSTGNMHFQYDAASRLVNWADQTNTALTVAWDHDNNRTRNDVHRTTVGTQTFTYNADDSVATFTDAGAATANLSYAAWGGLTDDGGCRGPITYNAFDELDSWTGKAGCAGSSSSYTHDQLGRITSHTDASNGNPATVTTLNYDGLNSRPVIEALPTGVENDYMLAPSGAPKAVFPRSSTIGPEYLSDDGHGNTALVFDKNAATLCTSRFDPWGNAINALSSTNLCNTGSTTQTSFYRSATVNVADTTYQLGERTYDPTKATFWEPDVFRTAPPAADLSTFASPLMRNRYGYVNGDPVNRYDPIGHMELADGGSPQGSEVDGCSCDDNLSQGNTDVGPAPGSYEPIYNSGSGLPQVDTPAPAPTPPSAPAAPSLPKRISNIAGALDGFGHLTFSGQEAQDHLIGIGQSMDSGWRQRYASVIGGAADWVGGETADLTSGNGLLVARGVLGVTLAVSTVIPGAGEGLGFARLASEEVIEHAPQELAVLKSAAAEGGGALLRAGARAGEGLPVSMRTVATVAEKYGIGLEGVDVSIAGPSRIALGETGPSGEILLYHPAFSSEEELAKTLMEERLHSWQVQTYGYNFLTHPAVNPYVEMETKAGVDAWFAAMTGGQ